MLELNGNIYEGFSQVDIGLHYQNVSKTELVETVFEFPITDSLFVRKVFIKKENGVFETKVVLNDKKLVEKFEDAIAAKAFVVMGKLSTD